jgi:hypothetical protein
MSRSTEEFKVTSLVNVFAPAMVCAAVERSPGLVPSASERVRTFEVIDPPFAFEPDGAASDVTMDDPDASLVRAIAADALISAFTISPSLIFAEVTALFAMVNTPNVFVTSPDDVVKVGTPEPFAISS